MDGGAGKCCCTAKNNNNKGTKRKTKTKTADDGGSFLSVVCNAMYINSAPAIKIWGEYASNLMWM